MASPTAPLLTAPPTPVPPPRPAAVVRAARAVAAWARTEILGLRRILLTKTVAGIVVSGIGYLGDPSLADFLSPKHAALARTIGLVLTGVGIRHAIAKAAGLRDEDLPRAARDGGGV